MKEGKAMIEIKDLNIPYVDKKISMNILKEYNLFTGDNGNGKTLLLDYISGVKKAKVSYILIKTYIFLIVYQEWTF